MADTENEYGDTLPHTVRVTFFANATAKTLHTENLSLPELQQKIQTANAASKDALAWLKLAVFGNKYSAAGSLRHNANVLQITGIEVDYDAEQIPFEEATAHIRDAELLALLYTSPSHSIEKPRWRILCPTSTALPPTERSKLVARLNGLFKGVFAVESFTLSQSFYFGSVNNNPAHQAVVMYGSEYIDLQDYLDETAISKLTLDAAPPRTTTGETLRNQPVTQQSATDQQSQARQFEDADPELIWDLLCSISPSIPRPRWINVGFALYNLLGPQDGFDCWVAWSKNSKKYKPSEMPAQWRSILKAKSGYRRRMGTLYREEAAARNAAMTPEQRAEFEQFVQGLQHLNKKREG